MDIKVTRSRIEGTHKYHKHLLELKDGDPVSIKERKDCEMEDEMEELKKLRAVKRFMSTEEMKREEQNQIKIGVLKEFSLDMERMKGGKEMSQFEIQRMREARRKLIEEEVNRMNP